MQIPSTPPAATSAPRVRVYDATPLRQKLDDILGDESIPIEKIPEVSNRQLYEMQLPLVRQTGQGPTGDAMVDRAFDNATFVDSFLQSRFGRNGWDAKGGALQVKVHFPSDNANWEYTDDTFWVGEDGIGKDLGKSLDVTAHEIAHGMFKSEMYASTAEANAHQPSVWNAAIDESFADVLAVQVDPDDWTVGEDVNHPDVVRDLEHPTFSDVSDIPMERVVDPSQPHKRIALNGQEPIGEHALSGIPSLAAVRTAQATDRTTMGSIWYRALTDHLGPDDGFEGAAAATLAAATELYGAGTKQTAAVRNAWLSVGVRPAAPRR